MKYLKTFKQINELIGGADHYHLYPALKKRLSSLMDSFENEHVDIFMISVKDAIIEAIIELYDIEDIPKNAKKIGDVFWLEDNPSPNKFTKNIMMCFRDKKIGTDARPFLSLVDKKALYEIELNYDDPEYGKKMKDRYSGHGLQKSRMEMACCYKLIEEIEKLFPKEVAQKEIDKDVYTMMKPQISSDDEDARNIHTWLYEVANLQKLFAFYLDNVDEQTYVYSKRLLDKVIVLFKNYLEKKEYKNIPFELFDYDGKLFHETIVSPWLSKFRKNLESTGVVSNTGEGKNILLVLEDVAEWYKNN